MNVLPTAPVAQWIARWTSNPKVVGSSPTWGSIFMSPNLPQFLQLHLLLLVPTMQLSTIDGPVLFRSNIFFFSRLTSLYANDMATVFNTIYTQWYECVVVRPQKNTWNWFWTSIWFKNNFVEYQNVRILLKCTIM